MVVETDHAHRRILPLARLDRAQEDAVALRALRRYGRAASRKQRNDG